MEGFAELDGGRVYFETVGSGAPTIVVPVAWGASHELYQALLGDLDLPLELVHVDPEGTGASSPLPGGWNPGRILDELDAVRSLLYPDKRVFLLGHASGAFLALAYALDHPHDVAGLILMSPFAGYSRANDLSTARVESHPEWPAFQERVQAIRRVALAPSEQFRAIFKEQRVVDMYDYKPHYFKMADAADEADFNPEMHDDKDADLLDDIWEIEAPTLIVTGEDDPLSPLEECRLMAGELPYIRLVELPRCGHYPFVEYPRLVEKAVSEYLDIVEGG